MKEFKIGSIAVTCLLSLFISNVFSQSDTIEKKLDSTLVFLPKNEAYMIFGIEPFGGGLEYKRLINSKKDSIFLTSNSFYYKMFSATFTFDGTKSRIGSIPLNSFSILDDSTDSIKFRAFGNRDYDNTWQFGVENHFQIVKERNSLDGYSGYVSYFGIINHKRLISQYYDSINPNNSFYSSFTVPLDNGLDGHRVTDYLGVGIGGQIGINRVFSYTQFKEVRPKQSKSSFVIGGFLNTGIGGELKISEKHLADKADVYTNNETANFSIFDIFLVGVRVGLKF